MKNSLLFLTIGAIVALLIVVSALVIWQRERTMYQVQPLSPSPSQAHPEPTQRPTPTPAVQTSSDIASWKTYRNEEYGFEVMYPLSWKNFENALSAKPTDKIPGGSTQEKIDFVLFADRVFLEEKQFASPLGDLILSGRIDKIRGFLREAPNYGSSTMYTHDDYSRIKEAFRKSNTGDRCPIIKEKFSEESLFEPPCTLVAKRGDRLAVLKSGSGIFGYSTAYGRATVIFTPKGFIRIALMIDNEEISHSSEKITALERSINERTIDKDILETIDSFEKMARSIEFR